MKKKNEFIENLKEEALACLKYYRPDIDCTPESYVYGYGKTHKQILIGSMEHEEWIYRWRCAERKQPIYSPWPGNIKQQKMPEKVILDKNNIAQNVDPDYFRGYVCLMERWKQLRQLINPFYCEDYSDNEIGQPTQFNFRPGKITTVQISLALLYLGLVDKFTKINRKNRNNRFNIVEIGGGYGPAARIFKTYFPKSVYIIFDLPQCLFLQNYYLKESFPNSRIANAHTLETKHSKLDNLNEIFDQYDFILLPPAFIEKIKDKSVDLHINTNSLPEMDVPQILYYYQQIERTCCGYFYQHNRITHKLPTVNFSIVDWPIQNWKILYSGNPFRQYTNFVDLLLKAPK